MTGTLTVIPVSSTQAQRKIMMSDGSILFTTSPISSELLGERLIAWDVLPKSAVEQGLDHSKRESIKLGRSLVALGFLTPDQVRASVTRCITERTSRLFDVDKAGIAYEHDLPDKAEKEVCIPTELVLLRGLQCVTDTGRVERWLGGMDQLLVPTGDLFATLSHLALDPGEAFVISRIDGAITPHQLASLGSFDEGFVLRLLCALRFAGLMKPENGSPSVRLQLGGAVNFDQLRTMWSPGPAPQAPAPASAPVDVDAQEAARICALIEQKLHVLHDGADHYAFLEVERRATPERIKSSYRELAKTFHPDRHAQLARYSAGVKDDLERIFAALTTASTTLLNPKERATYDQQLQLKSKQAALPTPPASAGRPHIPVPKPPPPPVKPPPAPPQTTAAPVPPRPIPIVQPLSKKAAHPKPPPPASTPPFSTSKPTIQASKPTIRATPPLTRPTVTERPVEPQASSPPEPSSGQLPLDSTPDHWYRRGMSYFRAEEYDRAIRAFEYGLTIDQNNARLYEALARAYTRTTGGHKKAEKAYQRAIELEPHAAEPMMGLAELYSSYNRRTDARELVLKVLEIDAGNPSALYLLESLQDVPKTAPAPEPSKKPSKNTQSGIFRRLLRLDGKD